MNKRAAMEFVVGLILVLLGALALFGVAQVINEQAQSSEPIESCLLSVKARATAKTLTSATIRPLDCERDWVFLEDESDDQVNARILGEIKDCARSFGDGALDFSESGLVFEERHCAMCASIEFADGKRAKEEYSADSWGSYLQRMYRDPDTSWAQFFEGARVTQKSGLLYKAPQSIDPQKKYMVFFSYAPATTLAWAQDKLGEDVESVPVVVIEQFPGGEEFTQCQRLLN